MRKIAWIIVGLAALWWPLSLSAQSEEYDGASFARVTYVKGGVTVARAGDLGIEEATINLALVEGDKISVREGRAEVDFGRRNFLRLDRDTEVEISNLPLGGDDRTRLNLMSGRIYLRVNTLGQEKNIEVHSPDASYYVLTEGLFRFDVRQSAETELAVLEGSIEAAGEGGSELVSGRERLVASNGRLGSQAALSYSRDDFDSFNEDRESKYDQYVSNQYLPAALSDYEAELSDNGTWVYEQPYGYVWAPRNYYSDWRPYYYGHWTWYASCGWTWIPEETWGWPVYHYGRWHWRIGLGWYWIPHASWGPAWVHWYHGNDYWGWCPLSWYNHPALLVDNYFYDRYHGSHYPGHNRAMTVVHRDQLQHRHVSQVALSRHQASGLGNISLASRQPDVRPTISRGGLRSAGNSLGGARTQVRSFERSLDRSSLSSLSRSVSRPTSGSRTSGSISRGGSPRSVSPGGLSSGTRPASGPRATVGSRPTSRAPAVSRPAERSSSGGIKSAPTASSSSPRSVAPAPRASGQRRATGTYSPSATISRPGTASRAGSLNSPGRQPRDLEGDRPTGRTASAPRRSSGTDYRSSPWPPSEYPATRLEKANSLSGARTGSRGFTADRSITGRTFSTPGRSSSGSRSAFSAPARSSSGSGRSYSSPGRSSSGSRSTFSAPARSSSGSGRSYSSPGRSSSGSKSTFSAPARSSSGSGRSSSSSGRSLSSPRSSSGSGAGRSVSSGSSGRSGSSSSSSSRGSGGRGSRRG